MSTDSPLTKLWSQISAHFNIPLQIGDKWLDLIESQYQRPYYDRKYLTNKLIHYESSRPNLKDPNAVLLALIFQSIHYETNASDNLERCNEKFLEFVAETGLNEGNPTLSKTISDLIDLSMSSSCNEFWEDGTFGQDDAHYFLDINFAHLATAWEDYKGFAEKTRNEYEFLSGEDYTKLRRKVLQSFLHIPNIYATAEFRGQLESKARENIQREIDELNPA